MYNIIDSRYRNGLPLIITTNYSIEDLKEKYVYVKGEPRDIEVARNVMFSMRESQYGFEGVCLAEKLDPLAGCDVSVEQATLSQISVAVMKQYSMIRE